MVTCRGGGTIGSPVDTSQAATPFHGRHGDPHAQGRVVGLLANLLHADRVEVERHAVIGVGGDVTDHVGEMVGGDVSADGIGEESSWIMHPRTCSGASSDPK